MRLFALLVLFGLFGCEDRQNPENGVYVTPREVFGVQSEVLELQNGKYRYWILGDVGPGIPFERSGRYTVTADRISFEGDADGPGGRLLINHRGMSRLLRGDAEEIWTRSGKPHPYGTLTKVPHSFEEFTPSTKYDDEEWNALLPKLPKLGNSELNL